MLKLLIILVQILFILRFHLELSRISAFSEPANSIRKLTNPLVLPLKRLVPTPAQKFVSIALAYVSTILILVLLGANVLLVAFDALLLLIRVWLMFLQYGLLVYALSSWIRHPKLVPVAYFLEHLFEPILRPIRPYVPPVAGMDFSPMVLWLAVSLFSSVFFGLIALVY